MKKKTVQKKKRRYPIERKSKLAPRKKTVQKKIEKAEEELRQEDLELWAKEHQLTIKRGLFILEYVKDFNGTQAAIRAGFSDNLKSAGTEAWRLLKNAEIQAKINERLKERAIVEEFQGDSVLAALIENHRRCAQAVPVVDMEGNETGVWKFDVKGSNKALELIGRHLELFPTNVKHSNDPENPIPQSNVVFYLPDNGRKPKPKN